jgi:hypothetical protein
LSANTGSSSYKKTVAKSASTADDEEDGNEATIVKIESILNKTFDIIIGIVMFLCFFALSSNMSANLLE